MILHIPHSSIYLPNDFNVLPHISIDRELNRMTDWFTDELFDFNEAEKLIFPYSRLYCDVERFRNDEDESMFKKGMGVCYTHTSIGKKLREVNPTEVEYIKSSLYDVHHDKLETLVTKALGKDDEALIIDCHSFSREVLVEEFKEKELPDICIGIDKFHADYELLKYAYRYFLRAGYTVSINEPFSGTMVPMKYYAKDKRVKSMMIEVNRELYLNATYEKNEGFPKIKSLIGTLFSVIKNKEYKVDKNSLEYRTGIDFSLVSKYQESKNKARLFLEKNSKIELLEQFLNYYTELINDREKEASYAGKEYINKDKKDLAFLQSYVDFENKEDFLLLYCYGSSQTISNIVSKIIRNIDTLLETYTFTISTEPLSYIRRL